MSCADDKGHTFPNGTIVCANGKVRWQCQAGEWVSLGVPCKPGDPVAEFDPERARPRAATTPP